MKDIKGFEGRYAATKDGRVWSYRRSGAKGGWLSLVTHWKGYSTCTLYKGTRKSGRNIFVHRLIAETFIPNPENKPCINHIDANKLNNHVKNLEWCTQKENTAHAIKLGLVNWSAVTKLSDKEVATIKLKYKSGYFTQKALANEFNISQPYVGKLINSKNRS